MHTLVIFSFIFYGWWDARFLLLILLSGFIDFYVSLALERFQTKRRLLLFISIFTNLGILGFFKYANFATENLNQVFSLLGLNYQIPLEMSIILPVGISFYTFQSMSYTIDVYHNKLKPVHGIVHFFAYLSMFPQLVAGPIVRAKDVLDQLIHPVDVNEEVRYEALMLILRGFVKKMLIADNLAPYINKAYAINGYASNSFDWWIISIAFALQIYFDFSGYTDIAIGIARSIGIEFKKNFNHPYISTQLSDFWRRWHISLSTWFRDYVYIPLGGKYAGASRVYFNIFVTMVLSGIWHGASWNFIVWGAFHGGALIIEKILSKYIQLKNKYLSWFITMQIVLIGWVFFRSEGLRTSLAIIKKMYSFNSFSYGLGKKILMIILMGVIMEIWSLYRIRQKGIFAKNWVQISLASLLILITIVFRGEGQEFIYFQF